MFRKYSSNGPPTLMGSSQNESYKTGMHSAKMNSIPLSLPPLAEQKRIVAKVDKLMQMCDRLEESLRQSQQTVEALAASAISHLTF